MIMLFQWNATNLLLIYCFAASAFSHTRTPRICHVKVRKNSTVLAKEIECYRSLCCPEDCCPWYINAAYVTFYLALVFLFWKIIEKCWHKYCRDVADTTINNDSQENMLMMSTSRPNSEISSRDCPQDYGSRACDVMSRNLPQDSTPSPHELYYQMKDEPPSYEEAVNSIRNQS